MNKKTLRPSIPYHPLAQIIPEMSDTEYRELRDDIKANGLREPIILLDDLVLDGRHRYMACAQLGIEPKTETFTGDNDAAIAFVISANVRRRHLNAVQKRDIIAKLLKATPEQSNRSIAKTVNVNHETVGAVRTQLEGTGEIRQLKKTTGADGKKRPAKKTAPSPSSTSSSSVSSSSTSSPKQQSERERNRVPGDPLEQFKLYARMLLNTLPVNERTEMARRWVAHLQLVYLPERITPPADAAQEAVDTGEVPIVRH